MQPLSGFEKNCIALLNAAPNTHATHCFRSAIYHLERAELIRELDPAMAIFRAITAEEEAASGVMRCLIGMGYPSANELNAHDHAHKHAVFPFLQVLGLFFGQRLGQNFTDYKLHIKQEKEGERLKIALNIGDGLLAYPEPPLNLIVTNPDTGAAPDYSYQINQLVKVRGMDTIKAFLKKEANLRNEILYAGPDGYPRVPSLDIDFLVERRSRVLGMIYLYLLLYPYREHQPLVAQALVSFVKMLGQLKRSRNAEKSE